MSTKIHFRDYNPKQMTLFPQRLDKDIAENDPVRLVDSVIDNLRLDNFKKLYKERGRSPYHPKMMLKAVIYGYMNNLYSCRKIEASLKRDIHFIWLAGYEQPDFNTINRFRNRVKEEINEVFTQLVIVLAEKGFITLDVEYIDGTKVESKANKYTFVWRKSTEKNRAKLMGRITALLEQIDEAIAQENAEEDENRQSFTPAELKDIAEELNRSLENGPAPETREQKDERKVRRKQIKQLKEHADKLGEYDEKLRILGDRNSYSKTDPDATFMRMKEDAMGNGQLKAGYNLQHGVDSEYVVWLATGPQPTDTTTLLPFLDGLEEHLGRLFQYKKIATDAGYESEENYSGLEKNGQQAYIKPSSYEISKKRKYKKDISRAENMGYDPQTDTYTCHNGKKLSVSQVKTETTKTGYKRETTVYTCGDCSGCPHKKECIRGNHSKKPLEERNKVLYVSKKFLEYREASLERIASPEGCQLRMNRSIQAEGSFGELKQDSGFRRFLCRGKENVKAEAVLLAFAHNVGKLHHKIQADRTGTHLFPLKKSA